MSQTTSNKDFVWRLRLDWEKNLPDLIDDYTHYQIVGDDNELSILDASKITLVLDLIQENFEKYNLILVRRAKINNEGVYEVEKNNFHITTYENAKIKLDRLEEFSSYNSIDKLERIKFYSNLLKFLLLFTVIVHLIDFFFRSEMMEISELYNPISRILRWTSIIAVWVVYYLRNKIYKKKVK